MASFESLPSVSIVIPTWNAASFIERVLAVIWTLDYPHFELIVVDNGVVNHETRVVVEKWTPLFHQRSCKLRILEFTELLGYAGAVNAGVHAAENDLVAVTNNDNLPSRQWLKELLHVWQKEKWHSKPIAVVTSRVMRPGVPSQAAGATNIWGRVVYFAAKSIGKEPYPVLHPDGSSFLMDRKRLGLPYDPEYFMYHEDTYLGWRVWSMGLACVFVPRSLVESFDGGTTRRLAYRTAYYSERNRILNWLLFLDFFTILRLSPLFAFDLLASFLKGGQKRARLHAWSWIFLHPAKWCRMRQEIQHKRQLSVGEVLRMVSASYLGRDGRFSGLKSIIGNIFWLYCRLVGLPLARELPREQKL